MSKYLERVKKATEALGKSFLIPGDGLLVERVPEGEVKTKSGLILQEGKQHNSIMDGRPLEVIVVARGEGFYDPETNQDTPLDTELGDRLIISHHTVKWFSTFPIDGYEPNTLGITNESATQIRFRGEASYERFKEASKTVGAEVENGAE